MLNIYVGEKIKYSKKAGIYKLVCINNGKIYIGKSVNINARMSYHKNSINRIHQKAHLRNAIIKYGWQSFRCEILEIFENFDKLKDNDYLVERESFYIQMYDSTNPQIGYNICKFSNDMAGLKLSEETKEKMRQSRIKYLVSNPMTEETKEKIRLAKKGIPTKPHTKEAIEKMRLSKLGKKRPKFSEQARENMSRGQKGRVLSEETKRKISLSNLGKPKSKEHTEKNRLSHIGLKLSEETKKKIGESSKGRVVSEETKEKLRQKNLGRKMSDGARENMRQAQLNSTFIRRHSEETKEKMRQTRLKNLELAKLKNNINNTIGDEVD